MGVDRCDVVGVAGRLNVGRRRRQSVVAVVGASVATSGQRMHRHDGTTGFSGRPARKWGQWARAWAEITTRQAARH